MSDTKHVFNQVTNAPAVTQTSGKEAKNYPSLSFRVTHEQKSVIRGRARKAGMPLSKFLRTSALSSQIIVRTQTAYGVSLVKQLKRIGVNLNQLMPYVHREGEIPPEMPRLWAKIEALLDKLLRAE